MIKYTNSVQVNRCGWTISQSNPVFGDTIGVRRPGNPGRRRIRFWVGLATGFTGEPIERARDETATVALGRLQVTSALTCRQHETGKTPKTHLPRSRSPQNDRARARARTAEISLNYVPPTYRIIAIIIGIIRIAAIMPAIMCYCCNDNKKLYGNAETEWPVAARAFVPGGGGGGGQRHVKWSRGVVAVAVATGTPCEFDNIVDDRSRVRLCTDIILLLETETGKEEKKTGTNQKKKKKNGSRHYRFYSNRTVVLLFAPLLYRSGRRFRLWNFFLFFFPHARSPRRV